MYNDKEIYLIYTCIYYKHIPQYLFMKVRFVNTDGNSFKV